MDAQFQFWVSITFAVLVAGYVAQGRFSTTLRFVGAMLYGLASFVLISRFMDNGLTAAAYLDALDGLGGGMVRRPTLLTLIARYCLFAGGTVAALYFLLRTGDQDLDAERAGDRK